MSEWQPIETAPREYGRYVLACRVGGPIGVLGWDEDDGCHFWLNGMLPGRVKPTHWLPLPEPPTKRDEG